MPSDEITIETPAALVCQSDLQRGHIQAHQNDAHTMHQVIKIQPKCGRVIGIFHRFYLAKVL